MRPELQQSGLHHAAAVSLNDKLDVVAGFAEGWTPSDEPSKR
jgi:hypothetical protein